MRAMILAAGRGARMGSMTENLPKPLLKIGEHYLIEYALFSLADHGVKDIVINVSYYAEQVKKALGDGARYDVRIHYSFEEEALETGGGIFQALPLFGDAPFIVLSSDVITDYPLKKLPAQPEGLAHLVLVDNPSYHPTGDFCLTDNIIHRGNADTFTFGNVGIYRPELFAHCQPGKFRLGTLLNEAISQQKVTGEHYQGLWHNLGTPEDLNNITVLPDIRQPVLASKI